MPDASVPPQPVQDGWFKRVMEWLFGKELDSVAARIQLNPEQARPILFSFLLSVLVKKTIISFILAALAFLGLPQLVLLAYAMLNGLPVFDVFDAMGDYQRTFTVLAFVFTAVLVVALAIPGLIWSFDRSVRDMSWFKSSEMGDKETWIRVRWAIAFLPGV